MSCVLPWHDYFTMLCIVFYPDMTVTLICLCYLDMAVYHPDMIVFCPDMSRLLPYYDPDINCVLP